MVKPRAHRRSRAQWLQLIEEQSGSDLSLAAFCAARGILVQTFRNARKRLQRSGATVAEPAQFVPLEVVSSGADRQSWELEVALGDSVVVRLRRR